MYDALVFVYKFMEPEEVVEEVLKDMEYYQNSGGGLTITGGEPMLQKEFIKAVFDQAKTYGIHNALDTAANIPWEDLENILPSIDLVLLDLKVMDEELHINGTGVSNRRILQNAINLSQQNVDLIVRIPVVPGINATEENMRATAGFLQNFPRLKYVELLPYHDLGVDKYSSLGYSTQDASFEIPSQEEISHLSKSFTAANIPVVVR
jgi:pyruvate formate lyase activating enzyme